MASDKMLQITAQQPSDSEDDQLYSYPMDYYEILVLISATHIVPAEENFDADSLLVVVKNSLRRSTHIVDNVLLGQEHLENLEEKLSRVNFDPLKQLSYEGEEPLENLKQKVSRASFNPLLCTLKQLFSEMACKAPGVETAQKTTISILNKLSRYSWDDKTVLTLAVFALDYEDFSAVAHHFHSSHQQYGKTIGELNKIVNDMLDLIETFLEVKKLSNSGTRFRSLILHALDPFAVYWIIITVVACTAQMCCLSDKDKTQELLSFAQKISYAQSDLRNILTLRDLEIAEMKTRRKLKELLQTPDEITEVFKALVFAKDDMQPLIDGSTNKMVSIDVIKKKNVLLLISGLNISMHDILILKSIYDGILREEMYDDYKIVWIPVVEQWTDGLQKKFEMLRSKMPWYIVQYFSPLAGIKFIKEEWHFENEPIVVMMNPQGDVFNENALHMIRDEGMHAFPFAIGWDAIKPCVYVMHPPRPYAIEEYTFFCGGNDNRWIEQFSKKVNVLAQDPITKEAYISIELSCAGNKTESKPENSEIQKLLLSLKNESKWAVLTKWSTRVVSDHGTTILKVLEAFEEWKVNLAERGFEICFKEYHGKFLQTGPLPSTS